ncbi:hypothetical protein NBRC10512_000417 [Rhodotorula toruloides]|uniref:RHTO0S04e11144g1_1 n=2 Tax=Rhodotorula toruloides TaxID=5286 RepID=A0A061AQM1_RHOTO|nr:Ankyrin repeat protein [Rhodotorula toruloides NP11]EMS19185.1 Ankyrin repeat protein [Rhodotorula toruloides NP11]KAJ8293689.1 putative ankyrin repeat protein [Rhodotorula toruloides]CDR39866.1 RHTO0S04e11144g1_1 [Rhodotorula toruloides]
MNADGTQELFDVARRGDAAELATALDGGASPDATNENGDTLVMLAAYHGHAEAVKLLLQRGADPNRLNNRQQSPLSGAVYKQDEAVIEALLAGGANPHIGAPTAWQAAKLFRLEKWEQRFLEAR